MFLYLYFPVLIHPFITFIFIYVLCCTTRVLFFVDNSAINGWIWTGIGALESSRCELPVSLFVYFSIVIILRDINVFVPDVIFLYHFYLLAMLTQ